MKRVVSVVALLGFFIIGAFFAKTYFLDTSNSQPEPTLILSETKKVQISVDFGDGQVITESFEDFDGKTAFDLLKKLTESKDLKLETKIYDFGVFVQAIDGKESGSDKAWIYFVNGMSAQLAADRYQLQAGDNVEWKYKAPSGN